MRPCPGVQVQVLVPGLITRRGPCPAAATNHDSAELSVATLSYPLVHSGMSTLRPGRRRQCSCATPPLDLGSLHTMRPPRRPRVHVEEEGPTKMLIP